MGRVAGALACALAYVAFASAALGAPVAAAATTSSGATSATAATGPCGPPGVPPTTVFLPDITKTLRGSAGWVTPFIVQNVGVKRTALEVSFFRFSDGALVTCRKITDLAPATSFADFPNADTDLPADSQFAVVVKSFGSEVVAVVNEHQGLGTPRAEALSYNGLTTGATSVYLPFVGKPRTPGQIVILDEDGDPQALAVETLLVLIAERYTASSPNGNGSAVPAMRTTGTGRALV